MPRALRGRFKSWWHNTVRVYGQGRRVGGDDFFRLFEALLACQVAVENGGLLSSGDWIKDPETTKIVFAVIIFGLGPFPLQCNAADKRQKNPSSNRTSVDGYLPYDAISHYV